VGWLAVNWPWIAGSAVMVGLAAWGYVNHRSELRQARGSRWATWADEPLDLFGDGDDER
jgi:hypothetical protein